MFLSPRLVLVTLLLNYHLCVSTRAIRSLPKDFPNSRRSPESHITFPSPQEALDLRLHQNEENSAFPRSIHEEDTIRVDPGDSSSTERNHPPILPSTTASPPAQKLPAPSITFSDTAWKRFRQEWDHFTALHQESRLTEQDKIHFLDNFRKSELLSSLIWPLAIFILFILACAVLCFMCCCVKRPIYCLGKQLCDFSKDSAHNHHKLKNIEMTPIIKQNIGNWTDDDLDRLAYLLHRRQRQSRQSSTNVTLTSSDNPPTTGYASYKSSPVEEQSYDDAGTPLPSHTVQIHVPKKADALIEV